MRLSAEVKKAPTPAHGDQGVSHLRPIRGGLLAASACVLAPPPEPLAQAGPLHRHALAAVADGFVAAPLGNAFMGRVAGVHRHAGDRRGRHAGARTHRGRGDLWVRISPPRRDMGPTGSGCARPFWPGTSPHRPCRSHCFGSRRAPGKSPRRCWRCIGARWSRSRGRMARLAAHKDRTGGCGFFRRQRWLVRWLRPVACPVRTAAPRIRHRQSAPRCRLHARRPSDARPLRSAAGRPRCGRGCR